MLSRQLLGMRLQIWKHVMYLWGDLGYCMFVFNVSLLFYVIKYNKVSSGLLLLLSTES